MRTLGLIGAIWFVVSIPVALFLGRVCSLNRHEPPQPLHLVSDERHAEQAGEQR